MAALLAEEVPTWVTSGQRRKVMTERASQSILIILLAIE